MKRRLFLSGILGRIGIAAQDKPDALIEAGGLRISVEKGSRVNFTLMIPRAKLLELLADGLVPETKRPDLMAVLKRAKKITLTLIEVSFFAHHPASMWRVRKPVPCGHSCCYRCRRTVAPRHDYCRDHWADQVREQ